MSVPRVSLENFGFPGPRSLGPLVVPNPGSRVLVPHFPVCVSIWFSSLILNYCISPKLIT